MMFRPDLADAFLRGRKVVTRRAFSDNPRSPWAADGCKLVPGRSYAVCTGRGKPAVGRAIVHSVTAEHFDPLLISDAEAIAEGFTDAKTFRAAWSEIHSSGWTGWVWRVELRLPLTCDTVAHVIESHDYRFVDEAELQRGVGEVLQRAWPGEVLYESRLTHDDPQHRGSRIDLRIRDVGVEIKVDGQWPRVQEQLGRYAAAREISELVLVTTRATHLAGLKGVSYGTECVPIRVVSLAGRGL